MSDRQGDMLRWVWRDYLKRFRLLAFGAFILMAIEGGMLGLLSYMVQPMFDRVLVAGESSAVTWVALAVAGVFVLRAVTGFGHRVIMHLIGDRVVGRMQSDLARHILSLDLSFFQDHAPGTLLERVRGDTAAIAAIWSMILGALGRDLVALFSLLAVAISIDWVWTLIAAAGAPILLAPMLVLQRWIRRLSKKVRETAARLSTRLDEMFHGIRTIKLNTTEDRDAERYQGHIDDYIRLNIRAQISQASIPALMDIVAAVGFFGVLIYGGHQIIAGEKTVGQFMSFFTAMALVFEPMRRIANVTGAWQVALASLDRLYEVFRIQPQIRDPAQPAPPPSDPHAADVCFEKVSFSYGEGPVLKGFSLTAKAGETTALVGPSGAGKSTVFTLLSRLAEPQSGRIAIGGTPVETLALPDLRGMMSVVSQDAPMFDESLADNITLFDPAHAGRDLRPILEAAHIADFVDTLPEGAATRVGPRGSSLSGGQRQRVAIARALLRDSPILLLDEATSALDAKSEAAVHTALEDLRADRTTLVIAHRLSTVREADKIVVMDKGRVVDEGTHDELLARDGLYAGLYRLQFAQEADP